MNIINIFIIIFTYMYVSAFIRIYISNLNSEIKNDYQYYQSFSVVFVFFFLFLFILRIFRIFLRKTAFFDFFFNLNKDFFYLIMLIIILLVLFRNLIFFIAKVHFIRIFFIYYFDLKIFINFLKKKSKIIVDNYFLFNNLLKVLFLVNCFYGIIFNEGMIYIGFLPFYAIYYFLLRIIKFVNVLVENFDLGCCYFYRKNVSFNEKGLFKLREYRKFLILNFSPYIFSNGIVIDNNDSLNILCLVKNDDFVFNEFR